MFGASTWASTCAIRVLHCASAIPIGSIGSRRGGLLPVQVWVNVQLAYGLLPLRMDHGGYFGLEEESWASKQ